MSEYDNLTEAAFTEQPLDEEQQKLLQTVYDRLTMFEEGCRPWHEKARDARAIVRLQDPEQDPPGAKEKALQLQTLKSTVNNCVADQVQNIPEAKLLPETPDKQDAADDLQDLVHHVVYEVNNFDDIHRKRSEDFYITGTVVTQIAWDENMSYGKGDIALIRWPLEAFLWDPQADCLDDCRAVMKLSWHPLSWYKEHWPEAAPYIADEEDQYNQVGMSDNQKDKLSNDEGRAMMIEYWYRTYDAKKNRYKINVAYCAGHAMLDEAEDVYMHGMYPFVVERCDMVEGSLAGDGIVSELTPMMRYINRYAQYIDTNLRMSSKGRLLTRRGANIDKDALSDWSQDIIEGDRITQGEDVSWLQNVPFNGLISNQMLQFQTDLKADAGANQFTRGETTGGIVSGKAISALQTAGAKIQVMRTQILNNGFKQIVKQILWLMAEFYDDDRVVMVTGRKDGQRRAISMKAKKFFDLQKKKGAIAPPPYTVQVEVITRDPSRIDQINNLYMQAFTMAAQMQQFFPLSALFRLLNIEGKDRLLPVIEASEQQQQMMQMQQQQIEQLTAQMEQMQKENESLKLHKTELVNALASAGNVGTGYQPGVTKAADTGGQNTIQTLIEQQRAELARPEIEL
jgi:hypothetical protein